MCVVCVFILACVTVLMQDVFHLHSFAFFPGDKAVQFVTFGTESHLIQCRFHGHTFAQSDLFSLRVIRYEVDMQMRTCLIQMQHRIENKKIWIAFLKASHEFIEHLTDDLTARRTARSIIRSRR